MVYAAASCKDMPTICNRARLDKTFNDPPGTYTYKVLRIADAKSAMSNTAEISVTVAEAGSVFHAACGGDVCTQASGPGVNSCGPFGSSCIPLPGADTLPDLVVSQAPALASGTLEHGRTVTFRGKVKNQSDVGITVPFVNTFFIDIANDGSIDLTLRPAPPSFVQRIVRQLAAAAGPDDVTLPLPPTIAALLPQAEQEVTSGEWRGIPEGEHRVILCADTDKEIAEENETNNCSPATGDTGITVIAPRGEQGGPLRVTVCDGAPASVRAGESVLWSAVATGGNGPGSYAYSWSGDAPLEGSALNPVSISYPATGTKSGSVIVTSGSETASRSCGTVNVAAGILSFTATPSRIAVGESSTLRWDTTGFVNCEVNQGIGAVPTTGERSVSPREDTRYTLTCQDGSASQSITVTVGSVPVIREITPE